MASIPLRDGSETLDARLTRIEQFDEASRAFGVAEVLPAAPPFSKMWACDTFLNQGHEGSCTGHGWAHELAADPVVVPVDEAYAVGIYWDAQRIDQYPGGAYPDASPKSEGSSVLAGAKVIKARGFMPEYRWCFGLNDLISAVAHLGPAVIGVNWYMGMMQAQPDGFIHRTGRLVGGHCLLVQGVDMGRLAFRLHNSWGPAWSDHGGAWLSFGDMGRLLHERGEACIPMRRTVPAPSNVPG